MIKITGLDRLEKELRGLSEALKELDGELGTVSFNPEDPGSIENAIREMEAVIDSKVASFRGNSTVDSIVESMKAQFRESILERAAEARLEGGDE